MQTNYWIAGVVMLVVGLGLGYVLGVSGERETVVDSDQVETTSTAHHVMPDGSVMSNEMSMAEMMASMNLALAGKSGDALDKAFLEEMIVHHQGAVEMAQILVRKTERPELVKLGNEIIAAQEGEIEMMEGWLDEWFGR
jgi:uncharacterized protein (DUF305 family)